MRTMTVLYGKELRDDEKILNGLTRKLNRAADKCMSILYDKIEELA